MKLLSRYLVRQNLFLVFVILLVGVGIYVLTDLFELLDRFVEAKLPAKTVLWYYAIKLPAIVAQLLPAIFLLAMVLQLNMLERSKELVALYSGGISPFVLLRFIVVYSLVWAVAQLFFAEALGVTGEREARRIWQEQVQQTKGGKDTLNHVWFTDKEHIVYVEQAAPNQGTAQDVRIYTLAPSGTDLESIISARTATLEQKAWQLHGVTRVSTQSMASEQLDSLEFPLRQDLKAFLLVESWSKPERLPLWELRGVIKRLERAGSNIENLRTVWHAKIAYAGSIIVMGLLALAIMQHTQSVYKAVGVSLVAIFFFYSANTISVTIGKGGSVPPVVAAWLTNGVALLLLCLVFLWPWLRRVVAGKRS